MALQIVGQAVDALIRHLLALVAGLLPRRVWRAWEHQLPVPRMAPASALLTFMAAFAVGVPAFLRYATAAGSDVSRAMIVTAEAVNTGRAPASAMPGSFGVSMFSLAAFALFTPMGWLADYLLITGLYRSLAAATGEAVGDPVLAALEHGVRTTVGRWRERREAQRREAMEGPEVPEVLLGGREGGAPEAAYVLIASRRKPGWDPGTFVVTQDSWYRIGRPFDCRYPDGLRRVYPLIEPARAEVIRRQVRYELPEMSESYPVKPRP